MLKLGYILQIKEDYDWGLNRKDLEGGLLLVVKAGTWETLDFKVTMGKFLYYQSIFTKKELLNLIGVTRGKVLPKKRVIPKTLYGQRL